MTRTKLTYGSIERYLEHAGPLDMPEGETFTLAAEWPPTPPPVPMTFYVEGDEVNGVTVDIPHNVMRTLIMAQLTGQKAALTITGAGGREVTVTLDPVTGEAS